MKMNLNQPLLGKYVGPVYAILRIVTGFLFACHGAQKLFGVLGGTKMTGNPLMLAAGLIELIGGILVLLGLFASLAAVVCFLEMVVAYVTVHAHGGLWPIENKGELAVLYAVVFLFIAAYGSGIWSADAARGGGRRWGRK